MSHYANQPGRLAELALANGTKALPGSPNLARVATLQTNGTKALSGSVRVHMQSFEAAQNVTLC